jgi:AbrB family looped-hinge helix DNA binding protein
MPPKAIINIYVVKVRAGYQITIPAAFIKELGIMIGDLLSVTVQNGRIILTPVKDPK